LKIEDELEVAFMKSSLRKNYAGYFLKQITQLIGFKSKTNATGIIATPIKIFPALQIPKQLFHIFATLLQIIKFKIFL